MRRKNIYPIFLDNPVQTITGAGDILNTSSSVRLVPSQPEEQYTLPDGSVNGQVIYIYNQGANTATVSVSNAFEEQHSTIIISADTTATLLWTGLVWVLIQLTGEAPVSFMNYPGPAFTDSTSTVSAPTSSLSDYVFSIERSTGVQYGNNVGQPVSNIHVSNFSNPSSISSFSWTPPSSDVPDFINANEMLIWGDDIYVIYKWQTGSNQRFLGPEYADGNSFITWDSNGDFMDPDGEVEWNTNRYFSVNRVVKFSGCSIDEANQQINYNSVEYTIIDFAVVLHGNAVTDGYWVLTPMNNNLYKTTFMVKIPLSGSVSNYELELFDDGMTLPLSTLAEFTGNRTISSSYGTDDYVGHLKPVFDGYNEQITATEDHIYVEGSVYFDSVPAGTTPPWDSSISRNNYMLAMANDKSSVRVLFPMPTGLRAHPTIHGNTLIVAYGNSSYTEICKYDLTNSSLDIKKHFSTEEVWVDGTNVVDEFNALNSGEATMSATSIKSQIAADNPTYSTFNNSTFGDYFLLGGCHSCITDGTHIWVIGAGFLGLIQRYSFSDLSYQESISVDFTISDDICIQGDYLCFGRESGAYDSYYVNKTDFATNGIQSFNLSPNQAIYGVFNSSSRF